MTTQTTMLPTRILGEFQWRIMAARGASCFTADIDRHRWEGSCTSYGVKYMLSVSSDSDANVLTIDVRLSSNKTIPSWIIALTIWGLVLHETNHISQEKIQHEKIICLGLPDVPEEQEDEVHRYVSKLLNMSETPCFGCLGEADLGFLCPCRRARYCSQRCDKWPTLSQHCQPAIAQTSRQSAIAHGISMWAPFCLTV